MSRRTFWPLTPSSRTLSPLLFDVLFFSFVVPKGDASTSALYKTGADGNASALHKFFEL